MGRVFKEPKLLLQEFSGKHEARLVEVDDYRWGDPGGDYYIGCFGGLAKQKERLGWCLTLDAGLLILGAFLLFCLG